jgi:hypothetical protein
MKRKFAETAGARFMIRCQTAPVGFVSNREIRVHHEACRIPPRAVAHAVDLDGSW